MGQEQMTTNQISVERSTSRFSLELPRLTHFINGQYTDSSSGGSFTVVDPARGEPITHIPLGGQQEVDQAVQAARTAAPAWGARTPSNRAEVLLKIADILEANAENLQQLEGLNCGKPPAVAEDDINGVVDTFRFFAGAGRTGNTIPAGDYVEDTMSYILREPVGVIGMITPWNYPLLMAAWKIAPALMMGNTVVLKPSEVTPLTTLRLVELTESLLPPGVLNVVLGDGAGVGSAISHHPNIDMVALTGSVRAGKSVSEGAAHNVTRVHLELGGKAPVLVCNDANLDQVTDAVFEAGFWNSGQECGAACRIIAHESLLDKLVTKITAAVQQYVLAEPEVEHETSLGPLIYGEHFRRVATAIDDAVDRGAEVLLGGRYDDSSGFWVEPTILKVPNGDPITHSEVFGPVVSIETFSDLTEGVALANDTEYGLTGSVFTEDVSTAINVSKQLEFGSVNVNTHLALPTEMPWSGFKNSGYGRDLSAYALDDYSRTKHIAIQH